LGSFLLLPLTKQLAVSGSCVRMCSLTLSVHAVGCCRSRMTSGPTKPLNSATTSGELIARHVETKTACLRFSPGRQPAGQPPARPLTQLASSWTWLQHDYCCRCASAAVISTLQGPPGLNLPLGCCLPSHLVTLRAGTSRTTTCWFPPPGAHPQPSARDSTPQKWQRSEPGWAGTALACLPACLLVHMEVASWGCLKGSSGTCACTSNCLPFLLRFGPVLPPQGASVSTAAAAAAGSDL
jgi:hypothetical protein